MLATSIHDAKKAALKIQKLDLFSCCMKVNSKWNKNIKHEALRVLENTRETLKYFWYDIQSTEKWTYRIPSY